MESGIYQWRSIRDSKVYIGQAQNLRKRKNNHFWKLRKNIHENIHLQRAWNLYGEENFIFEILLRMEGDLSDTETIMINAVPENMRYNIALIGGAPMKGRNHTEKTILQMSESHKLENLSLGTRSSMSKASKNKPKLLEHRTKMSESAKNRLPATKETRKIMSESHKGLFSGEKNPKAKLTEIQVREIKYKHLPEGKLLHREIGKLYGVNKGVISKIATGKRWGWLTE